MININYGMITGIGGKVTKEKFHSKNKFRLEMMEVYEMGGRPLKKSKSHDRIK